MSKGKEVVLWKDEALGITYYKREGGNKHIIHFYFTVNSKRVRLSSRTTDRRQAAIVAQEKYALATEGKDVRNVTFSKAMKDFLEYKQHRIASSTYDNYKVILSYANQFLGDYSVREITNKTITELEKWRREYYKNHPQKVSQKYKRNGKVIANGRSFSDNVSNRTINLTISLSLSVLRHASDQGHLEKYLIPDKWKKLKEGKRTEWLTIDQFTELKEYYDKTGNVLYSSIITFCYFTGIRPMSEVNRLQWKDVNFEKRLVLIRNRKHKSEVINSLVPLFPDAIVVLKEMKKLNKPKSKDDFVFVNENGRQVQSIRKSFSTAVRKCGLSEKIVLYSLRHSFTTTLMENTNIPIHVISRVLGHSDTKMVDKHYGHFRDDVAAQKALEGHKEAVQKGVNMSAIDQQDVVMTRPDLEMYNIVKMLESFGMVSDSDDTSSHKIFREKIGKG